MKRWLLIILMVVGFGCSNQNEIEVIQMDSGYRNLDPKVQRTITVETTSEELAEIANSADLNENSFLFETVLFIDETGHVDKMIVLNTGNEKFVNLLKKKLSNWKFSKIEDNGVGIKYYTRWSLTFQRITENDHDLLGSSVPQYNLVNSTVPLPWVVKGDQYYIFTDVSPVPIGGIEAIKNRVVYPDEAKRSEIEGTVFVSVFLNKEGDVVQTEIIRGIGGGCNEAAIDAIKATKFKPGRLNGKPVNVQVTIPIQFSLK